MKHWMITGGVLAAASMLFITASAWAQPQGGRGMGGGMGGGGVMSACRADIEQICDSQQGMAAVRCLMENVTEVSDGCADALAAASENMSGNHGQPANGMAQACRGDVAEYCADVEMGQGRIAQCLSEHRDELSEACADALPSMGRGMMNRGEN